MARRHLHVYARQAARLRRDLAGYLKHRHTYDPDNTPEENAAQRIGRRVYIRKAIASIRRVDREVALISA